ncbi:hypothetical protein EON65_58550 [archaeon]|nr:MAG: hypothetical protein EON65_58550 [archaeon]
MLILPPILHPPQPPEGLVGATSATGAASRPVLPGVATPAVDLLGALKVGRGAAGGAATRARGPVEAVHLPVNIQKG